MSAPGEARKLATILAADAAGYSRLMGDDEAATVRTLTEYRQTFTDRIRDHRGTLIDTAGDSVLAIFDSVVEAVVCATEIQKELARRNRQFAEHRRMPFRIGMNLGDVILREDGTAYGDGINIAARLQAMADPGGICISGNVQEQVEGKLDLALADLGALQVKNISRPVRAYKILVDAGATASAQPLPRRRWRAGLTAGVIAAAVLASIAVAVRWQTQSTTGHPDPAPTKHAEDKPSLAVLPFLNLSDDPKQEYLSDGMTEDIITALAKFTKLSVAARNSTFAYKGKPVDIRQVGKELNARYVLEGSVRRMAQRVRVTVQLIDASDGNHLWAQNYDRELKDFVNVQDEVIQQIVGRLDVELDRAQVERARRGSPKDFTAYDLVLQARKLVYDHSVANHRESRDLLERAVAIDDRLAQAYIELSWVYLDEYRHGWNPRPQPLDRAMKAAQRAVELDPNNGFAHWRLAKILFFRKEMDRFNAEMTRALELNPNHAETLADVATHLSVLDRHDEAYPVAERAAKLDPNLTWNYFTHARYFISKGRYQDAIAAMHRVNIPEFYWTHFWLAVPYAELGDMDAARREAGEVRRLKPDFVWMEEAKVWNVPLDYAQRTAKSARKAGMPVEAGDKWL